MVFKLIVATLAIGWAVLTLTSFCPIRAIRRRRIEAEIEADDH